MSERNSDEGHPAYISRCPVCAGMLGCCVDEKEYSRDTAKFVAREIRVGRIVERSTVGAVRRGEPPWCTCPRRSKKAISAQPSLFAASQETP